MNKIQPENRVQGEGDHVAGRRFQDAEAEFVKTGPVEQKAREAADALDGPEGAELEAARRSTKRDGDGAATDRKASIKTPAPKRVQTERRLDDSLEDTFPASDPVSTSPGSD